MKKLFLLLLFIFSVRTGFSQALSNYGFSAYSSSYSSVSGSFISYSGGAGIGSTTWDDCYYNSISIGFNFVYCGNTYTSLSASQNGWVVLGQTLPFTTTTFANTYDDDLANTTYTDPLGATEGAQDLPRPILAPLWIDVITSGPCVRYATTGTAPNRVFTIEWDSVSFYSAGGATLVPYESVELILHETTNIIDFAYNNITTGGASNTGDLAIGITDGTGSYPVYSTIDYWSLDTTGAAPSPSMTTLHPSLYGLPATNQVYEWNPNCTGTPSAGIIIAADTTGCSSYSSLLLLLGSTGSNGITYQWQSSSGGTSWTNISGATSDTFTAIVTANTYYQVVVTCTNSGLSATTSPVELHVYSPPSAISGISAPLCVGSTATFTDATSGGVWSSVSPSVASIGSSSAVVTGVSPGATIISYTLSSGCSAVTIVSVVTTPATISGSSTVCVGATTTLTDATPGATWSSSATSYATIGSATGVVSGIAPGPVTITYSLGSCSTTGTITVNPSPSAISGPSSVCEGYTIPLMDTTSGGHWSTTGTTIATVGSSSGIVTGIATVSSVAIIHYTLPAGCFASLPVTVNPLPAPIAGIPSICVGATDGLYSGGGSGAWSSSNTGIATISSTGVVTGVAGGLVTLSYTLPTGCYRTFPITVYPQPAAITGSLVVCAGASTTLSDTSSGGGWSSVDPGAGSVDPATGIVTGLVADTVTILYASFSTGCAAAVVVTVNPSPGTITGSPFACTGSTTYLSDPSVGGGSWSSSPATVGTIDPVSGVVSGIAAGTLTVSYTSSVTGCSATLSVSVDSSPPAISGSTHICVGAATTLSDIATGGSWISSVPGIVSAGFSTGTITGVSTGTASIVYTLSSGCATSVVVTVSLSPGPIAGVTHVCVGATTTLTDGSGGAWSISPSTVATIGSATGIVTGSSPGAGTITFSIGAGCTATTTITVNPLPGTVSGPTHVCTGAAITLSDGGGGSWFSTGADVSVTSATGAISGLSAGTAVITYALPTGCITTTTITVNPSPGIFTVTGGGSFCSGGTGADIGLSGSATGVSYELFSGSSAVTSMAGTGLPLDFGLHTAAGVYTIVATGIGSCTSAMAGSATISVSSLPGLFTVSGGGSYCTGGAGFHIYLNGSAAGVSYQLYNGATATGVAVTGTGGTIDFGVQTAAGTYTVVATNTVTGCTRTMSGSATITINLLPPPIVGPTALCVGSSIIETDSLPGGTWASSLPSGASVAASTGIVTGHVTGTCTTITYTLPTTCAITTTVCVSTSPGPVIGAATVCAGATDTLTDMVPGGVWTSGSTASATVGSLSGVVYGSVAGATTITYSLGTGCTVTKLLTITPSPLPITGITYMCAGGTTLLADATPAGIWSVSPAGIATVSSSGLVSGSSGGTATIAYTAATGCAAHTMVTVYTTPVAIGGPFAVCIGSSITETDATTGGLWSVSGAGVTIGSAGSVTGISSGPSVITYSVGSSGSLPGCYVTKTVTVNSIGVITGATGLCSGATTILSDGAGGGTWSSTGATGVVSVGSLSGIITGTGTGTAVITYSLGTGCTTTTTVTVNAGPSPVGGIPFICAGSTTSLTDTAGGGTWAGGTAGIATIDAVTGIVTGIAPGTTTVSYSLGTGCTVHTVVTVSAVPASITGAPEVCAGATIFFGDLTTGGVWSGASSTVATVSPLGTVSGLAPGTATISYTTGASGAIPGCSVTKTITVNVTPSVITGPATLCAGLTATFADTITGGAWSTPGSVATIDSATGLLTGISAGATTVTYVLADGCKAAMAITINPAPDAITGIRSICIGSSTTLSDATGGGVWSSSASPGMVTVGASTGIITGVSLGVATISYTSGICPALITVTVNSLPGAISGTPNVCLGETDTLADSPGGGLWNSSNILVASVGSATGIVSGIAPGTAIISYSTGVGCTVPITVTVHPAPPAISGPSDICVGNTATLVDPGTGGTWRSGEGTIATVAASTGVVSGVSGGIATISYTGLYGCVATYEVAVIAVPPILGVSNICAYGATLPVTDSAPGGAWTSALVSITPGGIITSYAAGVATIYYTLGDGCYTTATLTVNPLPNPISGGLRVCTGLTTILGETTTGGIWSSAAPSIATAGTLSGLVTGIAAGVAEVSYTLPTGCMQAVPVTVSAVPSAISGAGNICAGSAATLGDTAPGGIWSDAGPAGIATIGSITGIVTGITSGTTTITYTVAPLCTVSKTITVNAAPAMYSITGGGNYCSGGAGEPVTLGGSQAGISYQLYIGTSAAGSAVSGSGAALTFGPETAAGIYKIFGTNTTTSCSSIMADSATITISPVVTPSVNVFSSPGDTLCAGNIAAFTATEMNGGPTPTYQWSVNGTTVLAGSSSYAYTPVSGDIVTVLMTSDAVCAVPDTVSKSVVMTVDPSLIPVVTIAANPGANILTDEEDTLTAVVTGGGAPLFYQWMINGVVVPGATNAVYTSNNLSDGDSVCCIVYANGACAGSGTSCVRINVVNNVGIKSLTPKGEPSIWPNPVHDELTVLNASNSELKIFNLLGQEVYEASVNSDKEVLDVAQLMPGVYIVEIADPSTSLKKTMKLEVEH